VPKCEVFDYSDFMIFTPLSLDGVEDEFNILIFKVP
jgi:hypothetical protein